MTQSEQVAILGLRPELVSTHVLATISEKRSLDANVDLPFDDYYAYFCTNAFQPSIKAFWDGTYHSRANPVGLGPNPYPDTLSPLCYLVAFRNLFHSIART